MFVKNLFLYSEPRLSSGHYM